MKLFFYILFLSSLSLAVDLPQREVFMDRSGIVYIITRDLSTVVTREDGSWTCKAQMFKVDQPTYLKILAMNADKKGWLDKFNQLSRNWLATKSPWIGMEITKEQYYDWLARGGAIRTQEELDALKPPVVDTQQKQIAEAMALISSIKYYLTPDGFWHTDPNCIGNINSITINPFDVMKIPNAKACEKCTGVK